MTKSRLLSPPMAPKSAIEAQELQAFLAAQFSHLDHQLKLLDDKAETLDHKVSVVDQHFKILDQQVVEGKFTTDEVQRLNRELCKLNLRVSRLEMSHKYLTWALLGILGIMLLGFVGKPIFVNIH